MNWAGFWAVLAIFAGMASFAGLVRFMMNDLDEDGGLWLTVCFVTCAVCSAFAALMS